MNIFSYVKNAFIFTFLNDRKYILIAAFLIIALMLGYYYLFYYFGFGYLIFNTAFIYYVLFVSVILSIFIGLSLTFTIYSISKRIKVTKSVIGSIISSILPSTLCCSSILPTIIFSIASSYTAITLGGKIEAISRYII